jgi:hypothetical protein
LKERLETRGERRFWIVLGSVLALIAAIAVAGTLYAMGVFG